jgi:hypothetical protein
MKPLLIEDDLPASLGLRWRDQRRLYLARGFFALALYCYFLAAASYRPVFLDQRQLVAVLVSYLLVMGVLFWRARRNAIAASGRGRRSILNARLAMWVDYGALFIVVSHDPYDSIPAVLLLLPVLFGNGLRYGQRLLDEAVAGALVAVPVVIAFRGISGIVPQVDTMLTLLLYSVVVLYAGWLIRQASRLQDDDASLDPGTQQHPRHLRGFTRTGRRRQHPGARIGVGGQQLGFELAVGLGREFAVAPLLREFDHPQLADQAGLDCRDRWLAAVQNRQLRSSTIEGVLAEHAGVTEYQLLGERFPSVSQKWPQFP